MPDQDQLMVKQLQAIVALKDALTYDPENSRAAAVYGSWLLQQQITASRKATPTFVARAGEVLGSVNKPLNTHLVVLLRTLTGDQAGVQALLDKAVMKHLPCLMHATKFLISCRLLPLANSAKDATTKLALAVGNKFDILEIHTLTADYYTMTGEPQKALDLLNQCLESQKQAASTSAFLWRVMGEAKLELGNEKEAKEAFDKALTCPDENTEWDHGLPSRLMILRKLGSLHSKAGNHSAAQSAYYRAVTVQSTSGTWLKLGRACLDGGQWSGAEEAFAQVCIMDNQNAEVWALMALLCLRCEPKRTTEAVQFCNKSLMNRLVDAGLLSTLATEFLGVPDAPANQKKTLSKLAENLLRRSLAAKEDPGVRKQLIDLMPEKDAKDACRMGISPRKSSRPKTKE